MKFREITEEIKFFEGEQLINGVMTKFNFYGFKSEGGKIISLSPKSLLAYYDAGFIFTINGEELDPVTVKILIKSQPLQSLKWEKEGEASKKAQKNFADFREKEDAKA